MSLNQERRAALRERSRASLSTNAEEQHHLIARAWPYEAFVDGKPAAAACQHDAPAIGPPLSARRPAKPGALSACSLRSLVSL